MKYQSVDVFENPDRPGVVTLVIERYRSRFWGWFVSGGITNIELGLREAQSLACQLEGAAMRGYAAGGARANP